MGPDTPETRTLSFMRFATVHFTSFRTLGTARATDTQELSNL
jgi:hypothetical protein